MFVVVLAFLSFFGMALPPSMLGVAWPSLRESFGLPLAAAGMVPPVGVAASLVSTTSASRLVARFGVGPVVSAATLASAVALAGSAASVTWWQFLLSVAVLGLASGAIDATVNAYAARRFGPRRINLLHAWYGVGAVVSPLIVTATIATGGGWRTAYLIVAALVLVTGMVLAATQRRWRSEPAELAEPAGPVRRPGRLWRSSVVVGLAAVLVQSGLESAVAIWGYTFLTQHLGVAAVPAGGLASGYWLTLVVGRLGFGRLAERIGTWPVLTWAIALLVAAAVLVNLPSAGCGMVAVVLFGLACAPVYPLLVLTTAERTAPDIADQVVGLQAAASSLGAAIIPAVVGLAMQQDVGAFGPVTAVLVLIAAVVNAVMRPRRAPALR